MGQKFTDAARSTLSASIINTDTTLTISAGGSLFPVANTGAVTVGPALDWFKLVIQDATNFEIVYVRTHTSGSTTFTNVQRGQDGTTARSFASGSVVGVRMTAADAAAWAAFVEGTTTATLTNKRITQRSIAPTPSATPTINTDSCDIVRLVSLTTAVTSMTTNLTGTPIHGDSLLIEFTATGTIAIAWGAKFASTTVTLPTTTVGTTKLRVSFLYDDLAGVWQCVGVA